MRYLTNLAKQSAMKRPLITAIHLLLLSLVCPPNFAAEDAWVNTNKLNLRTCPTTSCEQVGQAVFHQKLNIFELKTKHESDEKLYTWVRISPPDAAPLWTVNDFLSDTPPQDPRYSNHEIYPLVKASDDFIQHKAIFIKLTAELIDAGWCNRDDFLSIGGWLKSSKFPSQPLYFTYCGGIGSEHRIYLNAQLGKVGR